jgi:hypothetical protein
MPSPPRALVPIDDAARAAAACHEVASEFGAWLDALGELGWPLAPALLDDGSRLPRVSGAPLDEPGPVVHLTSTAQALDGVRAPDLSTLGEHLAEALEARRRAIESSPFLASPRVYLAVDEDVAWWRLTDVISRAVVAGYERVSFVFVDPSRSAPTTPPSGIDDELAKLPIAGPVRRHQLFAEALAFVYKDCPSAVQLVAQFGHDIPELQAALVEQLPAALEGCGCAVDPAAVRALHASLFGNTTPGSVVTVVVAPTGRGDARAVRAHADLAWREAHGLLPSRVSTQARTTFEIEVPPAVSDEVPPEPKTKKPPRRRKRP